MMRSILWKEWREQRSIALALLAFGAGAIALTVQVANPSSGAGTGILGLDSAGSRQMIALALAYLAGSVCGAMLLADEKESRTMEFLDSLPCRRRTIWLGKGVFGVLFTIAQCIGITVLGVALGCLDAEASVLRYGGLIVMIGLLAFAWGMFGGALAKSTLGAVFLGGLGALLSGMLLIAPFYRFFGPRSLDHIFGLPFLGFFTLWLLSGFLAAAAVFTELDRRRKVRYFNGEPIARPISRFRKNRVGALVWLTSRQSLLVLLGSSVAGLIVGAVMLTPATQPVLIWPVATLSIGVLVGVTTLGEEQTRGVARFWAERRLPLGWLWLVKASFHLGIGAFAISLMALPLFVANPGAPFRTRLLAPEALRPELGRFFWLGLVYGFVIGHLAGMLFRKSIVAGLVAAVTATTFVGFIYPSVIAGGAASWQVWGPAIALLLTARLLIYPWATERIAARNSILRATGGGTLAAGVLAAGLAGRVYEIPDVGDALAESGFERGLPAREVNDGGKQAWLASSQYRRAAQEARSLLPPRPPVNTPDGRPPAPNSDLVDVMDRGSRGGWTEEADPFKPWLDRVFTAEWVKTLDDLDSKPLGVFEDPRDMHHFSSNREVADLREMLLVLRVRCFQNIAEGKIEEMYALLRNGLAAVRTARNKCALNHVMVSLDSEEALLRTVREYLARRDNNGAMTRSLLSLLMRHEQLMPMGREETYWAEQVILRNTLDRLGSWLPPLLDTRGQGRNEPSREAEAEAEVVAVAWGVPWERARRERILRAHTHSDFRVSPAWLSGLHLKQYWRTDRVDRVTGTELRCLTQRRFAIILLALRLFEIERARPAKALDELVPTYLASIPTDPFSGQPFHYRVSNGEVLSSGPLDGNDPSTRDIVVGAIAASTLAHPVGGLNGAWVIRFALTPAPAPTGGGVMSIGTIAGPTMPVRRTSAIPRGAGVLWSVGPDGTDNGGRRTGFGSNSAVNGQDWIVAVPPLGPPNHD
jgi:ABC-type transport system involved in multi-copper enzyme maturation permease subunit